MTVMPDYMLQKRALEALLARTQRRMVIVGVAKGAFSVAAGAAAALMLLFAFDRLAAFPQFARAAAAAVFIVVSVAFIYARILVLIVRPPSLADAARTLEQTHGALRGFALSAAELALAAGPRSDAPDDEFVRMTVERALERAEGTCPSKAIPAGTAVRPLAAALAGIIVWAAVSWLAPVHVTAFLRRFADPLGAARYPAGTRIVAIKAPTVLPMHAPFRAAVVAEGVLPDEAVFHVRPAGGSERRLYARGKNGRYECELENTEVSFSFFVDVGDARSRRMDVEVVERPSVVSLGARVTYPSYTGVGAVTITGGDVSALRKSRVELVAEFNKPVKSASLEFGAGGTLAAAPARPGTSAAFEFEITDSDDYTIALVDEHGFDNEEASLWRITAQADTAPVVTLVRPARDLTVVPNAVIPIEVLATDDYGVTGITLCFTIKRPTGVQRGEYPLTLEARSARSGASLAGWEIAALQASPGDEITYFARAADNLPDGPQQGESGTRSAAVVTVAEKLVELGRIDARVQADIGNAARGQEEAIRAVAQISPDKERLR